MGADVDWFDFRALTVLSVENVPSIMLVRSQNLPTEVMIVRFVPFVLLSHVKLCVRVCVC